MPERSTGAWSPLVALGLLLLLVGVLLASGLSGSGDGGSKVVVRLDARGDRSIAIDPSEDVEPMLFPLRPGERQTARLRLINRSPVSLAVGLAAVSARGTLDDALWAKVRVGGRLLARAPLADLQYGTPGTVVLGPNGNAIARLNLELRGTPRSTPRDRRIRLVVNPNAQPVR